MGIPRSLRFFISATLCATLASAGAAFATGPDDESNGLYGRIDLTP